MKLFGTPYWMYIHALLLAGPMLGGGGGALARSQSDHLIELDLRNLLGSKGLIKPSGTISSVGMYSILIASLPFCSGR